MAKQKKNYGKLLEKLIGDLPENEVPKLLLHACCGPCSSYVLEYLTKYFSIYLLYYNPNILPQDEYEHRFRELKKLCEMMPMQNTVKLVPAEYNPDMFLAEVKGLELEPEGGARCLKCYSLRMEEAAIQAKVYGCDYFTTTLTISPMKDAQKINQLGETLSKRYGVKHLPSDFKKQGGYQRSIELSRIYQLYRQDYCGCIFSKRQRALQKQLAEVERANGS